MLLPERERKNNKGERIVWMVLFFILLFLFFFLLLPPFFSSSSFAIVIAVYISYSSSSSVVSLVCLCLCLFCLFVEWFEIIHQCIKNPTFSSFSISSGPKNSPHKLRNSEQTPTVLSFVLLVFSSSSGCLSSFLTHT